MKSVRIVTVLLTITLLSCATTGPGGKSSVIFIPTSQEVAIGAGMAEQVAQTEKSLSDQVWQNYLTEIGNKIVAVCDRQGLEYHFTVIESDQINAFAAPGGYVYFYTGLLEHMDNEAELAAVMAHEISHVVARHGIKRLQTSLGVALAYELAFGDSTSQALQTAIGLGMNLAFASYSRSNEREADDYGMTYLVKAGYDPRGMRSMLEKLAELGSHSDNVFEQLTSSHPDTQERIDNAQARINEMGAIPSSAVLNQQRYQSMLSRLPASSGK